MPKCILKIRDVLSPVSETFRGVRVLIATPNATRSFERPWLVAWFGDYNDREDMGAHIADIGKALRRMGYNDVEVID